jgi:uroporphyrin-III C-methyltransferase / precorrin-2 dehydrogenase / sirohydrochlorin ferrochelatase
VAEAMAGDTAAGMPILLGLAGQRAVVIGGGEDAAQLVSSLLSFGADVTVVACGASLTLHALAASGQIAMQSRDYVRGDLSGAFIAGCFEGGETAAAVAAEAGAERCLVHIAGRPDLSSFAVANIVQSSVPTEEPA